MAIEVLLKADTASIVQKQNHDLESIFYVLLCFCYRYQGPVGMRHIHPKKTPVDKWFVTSQSYEDLAVWKSGQFINSRNFSSKKSPHTFEDLKPCLRKLFDIVFPPLSFSNGRSYRETASNGATTRLHCWKSSKRCSMASQMSRGLLLSLQGNVVRRCKYLTGLTTWVQQQVAAVAEGVATAVSEGVAEGAVGRLGGINNPPQEWRQQYQSSCEPTRLFC